MPRSGIRPPRCCRPRYLTVIFVCSIGNGPQSVGLQLRPRRPCALDETLEGVVEGRRRHRPRAVPSSPAPRRPAPACVASFIPLVPLRFSAPTAHSVPGVLWDGVGAVGEGDALRGPGTGSTSGSGSPRCRSTSAPPTPRRSRTGQVGIGEHANRTPSRSAAAEGSRSVHSGARTLFGGPYPGCRAARSRRLPPYRRRPRRSRSRRRRASCRSHLRIGTPAR